MPSARHLFALDGLDPVRAAPLTDAALTSYRAIRRVLPWTTAGATAIVIGAGGLGQFAVQWLKLLGDSRVVVVDPADDKRERAAELGADEAIGAGAPLPPARAVVDFVGSAETMRLAAGAVEPSGAVMSVGGGGGRLSFGLGAVPYESVFTTSSWGSRPELAGARPRAPRRPAVGGGVVPLDRVNDALARLRAGDVRGRLAITPWSGTAGEHVGPLEQRFVRRQTRRDALAGDVLQDQLREQVDENERGCVGVERRARLGPTTSVTSAWMLAGLIAASETVITRAPRSRAREATVVPMAG